MSPLNDLTHEWRELADQQRVLGAEAQARTLGWCADQLEDRAREWENEKLTLDHAAEESGYSADHLGRLVREGRIPNAGQEQAPRIRRKDLPRKPGHSAEPVSRLDEPLPSRTEMARSVVNSE